MIIGNRDFDCENHTYIMGILNVTPDSFSDGGVYNNIDSALFRVKEMIEEGADIIDVGGESTKPGFKKVSVDKEISRVIPVIDRIKSEFDISVSLDTYKAETAFEGLKAGADMINVVKNICETPELLKVISMSKKPCCLTHNRYEHNYVNFGEDFYTDLSQILDTAVKAGVPENKIILDPGIGFCKTREENLWVLNNMDMMGHLGCPWLLGASRKSVIGDTLELPVEERLEGTLATTALAVMKGASFVRVHDIKANKRLIQMLEAVKNA